MKKIKILLPILALALFSCDDYVDINQSPNDPTPESVTPNLALAAAISEPFRTFSTTSNELGNVWMQNWGANVNTTTGGYATEYTLGINSTFRAGIWDNTYLTVANLQNIITRNTTVYDNHKAIAKIMKVFYMQYIVDLYGNVPYSLAWDQTNYAPAYDDDQAIYRSFIVELKEAMDLIENADVSDATVGPEDVVFQGNLDNWEKFANTLRLRVLLRESEVSASSSYLATEFALLNGAEFLTADAAINPGYSADNAFKQNPFYGYFYNIDGSPRQNQDFIKATSFVLNFLDSTSDPRKQRLYAPATGTTYVGVVQGATAPETPDNLSSVGPALLQSASQNGYLITAAESYFLQSEAAFRGYLGGDAKTLFESGIQASFLLDGLTVAQFNTYLTAISTTNGAGWDASSNKIQAIMTQKWVALNGRNGIESFIEHNRTGFPVVPLATTSQYPTLPLRLFYPTSEYTGNAANVPNLTIAQMFSEGPFWAN